MDMYKHHRKKKNIKPKEYKRNGQSVNITNDEGTFNVADFEYVKHLEHRVKDLENKNKHMADKISNLTSQNQRLESRLKALENILRR